MSYCIKLPCRTLDPIKPVPAGLLLAVTSAACPSHDCQMKTNRVQFSVFCAVWCLNVSPTPTQMQQRRRRKTYGVHRMNEKKNGSSPHLSCSSYQNFKNRFYAPTHPTPPDPLPSHCTLNLLQLQVPGRAWSACADGVVCH